MEPPLTAQIKARKNELRQQAHALNALIKAEQNALQKNSNTKRKSRVLHNAAKSAAKAAQSTRSNTRPSPNCSGTGCLPFSFWKKKKKGGNRTQRKRRYSRHR